MREWENEVNAKNTKQLTLAKFKTKTVRKIYKALIFNYVFL